MNSLTVVMLLLVPACVLAAPEPGYQGNQGQGGSGGFGGARGYAGGLGNQGGNGNFGGSKGFGGSSYASAAVGAPSLGLAGQQRPYGAGTFGGRGGNAHGGFGNQGAFGNQGGFGNRGGYGGTQGAFGGRGSSQGAFGGLGSSQGTFGGLGSSQGTFGGSRGQNFRGGYTGFSKVGYGDLSPSYANIQGKSFGGQSNAPYGAGTGFGRSGSSW